ncbi:MAG: Ig-like domain-containing protein, partial [Gemmatimonas sp.]
MISPLVVKVTGANNTPIKGASVTFAVTVGAATVSPTTAITDAAGQAQALVTFGSAAGDVTITATVAGTSLVTTFTLTAGTTSTVLACTSASPQTPAVGGVLPGVSGTGICLGGGTTGADYAIVAFHGNPDSSAIANFNVTAHGATALTTPSLAPSLDATLVFQTAQYHANRVQAAFETRLRESARRVLTPMIPAARVWNRQRASFTAIPANPAIGTLVTLNANGNSPP